jgi:hypothetical protein
LHRDGAHYRPDLLLRTPLPRQQEVPRLWDNAPFNFDHLGNAMISLFVVATLNGYSEIMDSGEGGSLGRCCFALFEPTGGHSPH